MSGGHDHDHDHDHGHDHHGHEHGEELLELSPKKPVKKKALDADALIHVDGLEEGTFAIASSKKELKKLMKSDADVVYDEKKGKLYLNANVDLKGWGGKKVGGLLATFKSKPELGADQFEGLESFSADSLTGEHDHDHDHDGGDETSAQTMFSSKSAAKAAAKDFGCKGAHKHGDSWMVCNDMADMTIPAGNDTEDDHSGHDHSGHDHSGHDHASHRIV